ncbi:hypothetical protein HK405_013960 [Cladochytrium tenue]|nr:hypothetical protein HK405_013960 [Cladochytrium tenue]
MMVECLLIPRCCRTPTHALTAVVSFASIGFLVGMRWLKARLPTARALQLVPEILALVALSTLLCGVLRWDELGLDILRDVKGGLVVPRLVRYYLLSAVLISVIGFVESIAVAKTHATKYNYSMSPNHELVAIGAANVLGSVFGGWPAFVSLGRSAVNDASGARTQVAGFVTGVIILGRIQLPPTPPTCAAAVAAMVHQLGRAGAVRAARVSRSWAAAARPVVFGKPVSNDPASNRQSTTIDKYDDPVDAGDLMLEPHNKDDVFARLDCAGSPLTWVKELLSGFSPTSADDRDWRSTGLDSRGRPNWGGSK